MPTREFELKVVTPDHEVWRGSATSVVVPTTAHLEAAEPFLRRGIADGSGGRTRRYLVETDELVGADRCQLEIARGQACGRPRVKYCSALSCWCTEISSSVRAAASASNNSGPISF